MGACHSSRSRAARGITNSGSSSQLVQSNPLFASLQKESLSYDDDKLEQIGGLFQVQDVKAGRQIVKEGEMITALYIIVHGHVILTSRNSNTGVDTPVQQLSSNDFFGDTALIRSKPSELTATALSDTVLLKMDRQTFQSLIKIVPSLERDVREKVESRTSERLRQIPFFAAVRENKPWSKLDLLGSMFQFEEFTAGQTVFKEGEIGDKFFLIVHGSVSISIASATSDKPIVLDQLGPEQHFGEIALLKHTPRTATITCLTNSLFLSLSSSSFHSFLSIAPELASPFSTLIDARTANVLRTMDMFRCIKENKPWSKVEMLAHMLRYEHREEGQMLWTQGDAVNKLYIVTTGTVKEIKGNTETTIVSVSPIGADDLLFALTARTSSVLALSAVSLLSLDKEKWDKWITSAPEVRSWMMEQLGPQQQRETAQTNSAAAESQPITTDHHTEGPTNTTRTIAPSSLSLASPNGVVYTRKPTVQEEKTEEHQQHLSVPNNKDDFDYHSDKQERSTSVVQVAYHRESDAVNPDML